MLNSINIVVLLADATLNESYWDGKRIDRNSFEVYDRFKEEFWHKPNLSKEIVEPL